MGILSSIEYWISIKYLGIEFLVSAKYRMLVLGLRYPKSMESVAANIFTLPGKLLAILILD